MYGEKDEIMKRHKTNKVIDTRRWFDRWSNEYDRTLGSTGFHRSLLDLMIKNRISVKSWGSVKGYQFYPWTPIPLNRAVYS